MTTNFFTLASKFGTTQKLLRGKTAHSVRTVEEMRSTIIECAKEALSDLQSHKEAVTKNPMLRKIRNGFSIKIGYGKKNETLFAFGQDENGKDQVVLRFFEEDRNDAIQYLGSAITSIENCELDEYIKLKLESYQNRTAKPKAIGSQSKRSAASTLESVPQAA